MKSMCSLGSADRESFFNPGHVFGDMIFAMESGPEG
jgi:hypothetical protein